MKWLRAYLERREKLAERVALALEKGAERGPTEDAKAREAAALLGQAYKALADQLNEHKARLAKIEAGSSAALLPRIEAAEARADKLAADLRSLRGKVYRDPEFHKPREREEAADELPSGIEILGLQPARG